jgi:hypothetical protein
MENIVRQEKEEFGKDIGLIHEVVVTGRKVGATKEFWAKLAHDEDLFRSVVSQVLQVVPEQDWLGNILARERKAHQGFFGQEFDLASFQAVLVKHGPEAIQRWQNLGLEPHFLPQVAMSQDTNFGGWKVKPENWYYEQVGAGKILRRQLDGSLAPDREAFGLEGITVLVDTRLKPQYDGGKQRFKNDNLLGPIIEGLRREGKIARYEHGPQSSRFGVSANDWEDQIKPALAEFLVLEVSQVRLERTIEANVIPQLYSHMSRKDDGKTNVWVWYEEFFEGASKRLCGGYSGHGGLSGVNYFSADGCWSDGAFRPLVVLDD